MSQHFRNSSNARELRAYNRRALSNPFLGGMFLALISFCAQSVDPFCASEAKSKKSSTSHDSRKSSKNNAESCDITGDKQTSCDIQSHKNASIIRVETKPKKSASGSKSEPFTGYVSKTVLPSAPKVELESSAKELIDNSKKLHILRWQDNTKPTKAIVVAVHGTTQHAGSFAVLAQHLTQQGFVFIALDLRGHGERYYKAFAGQPNFRVDYDKSADDLGNLLKKVRATYPGTPVFCIGESVGATVATYMSARFPGAADGIILCSPGSRPRAFNPFMVVPDFVKGVTHLDEHMDVSRYIDHYSSDDKRVSDEMIADPLSRIKMTPKEILRTAFFIRTAPKAALTADPSASFLIIQGEKDGIVSTSSTHEIFKNLTSEHKQLIEFKDAGHVLLGTSYLKPQVVDSITNWLSEQADQRRTKVIGLHDSTKHVESKNN